MQDSINALSVQELLDRLHTAITEQDLLFTHYWIKELEARGEEGREAIRCGRHSWKRETAMQAVLLPPTNLSFERGGKVRKLIVWMLDSYSARLVELEGEGIQDSNALRKEWLELRMNSDEEERQSEWLLKNDSEDVGNWIDENQLRPEDASSLTGLNPLPPPSPSAEVPPRWKVAKFEPCVVEPSSSATEPSLPTRIETLPPSNSPSPPPSPDPDSPPPHSSVRSDVSQSSRSPHPPPLPSLPHQVRLYPFPHQPQAQRTWLKLLKERNKFSEEPQSYSFQRERAQNRDILIGFLLLNFETKEGATFAVEELRRNFDRQTEIELESDYQQRQLRKL
ncbi:hypothetical protein JCM5350_007503 [Sporobolomyces pararoseus]